MKKKLVWAYNLIAIFSHLHVLIFSSAGHAVAQLVEAPGRSPVSGPKFLFIAIAVRTSNLIEEISVLNFHRHMFDYVRYVKYNFRIRAVVMFAITNM